MIVCNTPAKSVDEKSPPPSSPAESTERLEHQILKLNGLTKPYCQIKWIFPSIAAPIKSLILLKSNSHAKMAPDTLRTPSRPRLVAPGRVFSRPFRGGGPVFRRRGAFHPQFGRKIRPAVGRRWRRRLALKSAAAVVQNLLKRREDEAALRDAIALARPGQELGPAGRVYAAFRTLADRGDPFRPERLAAVAADLQAPFDPQMAAELAAALRVAGGRGRPAPVVAAAAAAAVTALRADAEPLAIWAADAALSRNLGWPTPLPLLASELFARRGAGEGRRPRPGEAGWGALVAMLTRGRRSPPSTWRAFGPQFRRGVGEPDGPARQTGAIEALLADDAVSAAAPIAGLSDRARRRCQGHDPRLPRRKSIIARLPASRTCMTTCAGWNYLEGSRTPSADATTRFAMPISTHIISMPY